ncbi:alpha-1,3-galactosidase B [Flammeovirga sp. MY04]|uniref:alpha-1,3-galactosidase-related protein n=1 Tax=Flammeovirga sp. MY04 TaxID=1191459 RepID=UPI00080618F2|nr:hypothetical protein [Flammeovirga sp. MY04]ANQ48840.1 alpha-1,3-galactosidase B [Flammeovirga sp. MY04]
MKSIYYLLFFVMLGCSIPKSEEVLIINLEEYGILPNQDQSITKEINQVIKDLPDQPIELVFSKGYYHFRPNKEYQKEYFETNTYDVNPKNLAVFLSNRKDITINGQGSEFIFHDHIQPFTLDNCENVQLINFSIDWEQPLTAEGRVVYSNEKDIVLEIDQKQFPYEVQKDGILFKTANWEEKWRVSGGSWLIEYTPDHIIPANTGDAGSVKGDLKNVVYSDLGKGRVQLSGNFTKYPTEGNYWIMRHSTRDHAGIFSFHSKNVHIENVDVHHTAGLGILFQYTDNVVVKDVNIVPNPKKNRYLSGHDDGLHFMGCKGHIAIDNYKAMGLMDDAINIHGTYVPVSKRVDDYTLICNYAHDMSKGLIWGQKGDSVSIVIKENMKSEHINTLKSFDVLDDQRFQLTFNEKLPEDVSSQYSLENLTWTPSVSITNSYAGSNRARGYLISTPKKVVIENNVFQTSGSAILIAGDANYWYESGAVKDVLIKNNTFEAECNSSNYQFCKAIISIYPEIPSVDESSPYHQNIQIVGNTFSPSDKALLYAISVDHLKFESNIINKGNAFMPWRNDSPGFHLIGCKNVSIKENVIDKDVLIKSLKIEKMQVSDLSNVQSELSEKVIL